jgi:carboxyl-terminal processing protease
MDGRIPGMTSRRKFTLKIAMITMAFFCAYGLREAFTVSLDTAKKSNYFQLLLLSPKNYTSDTEYSDSNLFLDSIISIIQNYYVDQDRVAARELGLSALTALAQTKKISYRVLDNDDRILLRAGEEQFDLKLSQNPSFDEILRFYNTLGNIASRFNLNLGIGQPKDHSAPYVSRIIDAVLKSLDAHSSILSPEDYLELRQGTEGSFGGLGVLVGIRDEVLTVLKPIPGSPASKAGLQKNDRILSINGVNTFGKSLDNLVEHMRGDPGSSVRLSLLRHGARAPDELNLKREIVQVDSIETRELSVKGNKILRINIENFAARTSREVRSALDKFRKKNSGNIPGVVLDLRGNPGGLLDQAVQVADIFLPSGVIVSTKGRREEIETAIPNQDETDYPLIILIDEESASASEIVAGALQDHRRAVIIGQPSFGKGSVQTIFELPDERALKLTIARYFTPSGKSIQNKGIIPDIWIQPLRKKIENRNILGDQRYKNERFLRHRLDVVGENHKDKSVVQRKAYYLVPDHNPDKSQMREITEDQELNLALIIIEKVLSIYGQKTPSSGSRSSHWLALSGPEITKKLNYMDNVTSKWLEDKVHINWSSSGSPPTNPHIDLTFDDANQSEIEIASNMQIKWRIINREKVPIHRTSLYLRSDESDFDTQEILIGTLQPNQEISGEIRAPISTSVKSPSMILKLGVVVDGTPLPHVHAEHLVQIREKNLATLSTNIEIAEEKGGSLPGIIEQGEKAKLRLIVENKGTESTSKIKLNVINLGGTQFELQKNAPDLFELKPGGSIELAIHVHASSTIDSPELNLGICLDGENLKEPVRQRFSFKAQPSRKFSAEKSSSIGH